MASVEIILPAAQFIRIAGQIFPFQGVAEASRSYREAIRRLDLGYRDMPDCEILNAKLKPVGHVSYNGRVWAKGKTWRDDVLVYEPTAYARAE